MKKEEIKKSYRDFAGSGKHKLLCCSLCREEIGTCKHNRMDMIIAILQAWDFIKKGETD